MEFIRKITGEKIYLSPVDDSLTEKVTKWSNDLEVSLRTGDISDMITYEVQREYLNGMNKNGYAFYIIPKESNEAVGIGRLMRMDWVNRRAVMGMFIGEKENRDKGFGTEAIKLLLDYGFNVLNLRNIMVEIFSFNEPSIQACKKAGFKEIGRRRSAIIYGTSEFDEVYMDILSDEFNDSVIIKGL